MNLSHLDHTIIQLNYKPVVRVFDELFQLKPFGTKFVYIYGILTEVCKQLSCVNKSRGDMSVCVEVYKLTLYV